MRYLENAALILAFLGSLCVLFFGFKVQDAMSGLLDIGGRQNALGISGFFPLFALILGFLPIVLLVCSWARLRNFGNIPRVWIVLCWVVVVVYGFFALLYVFAAPAENERLAQASLLIFPIGFGFWLYLRGR